MIWSSSLPYAMCEYCWPSAAAWSDSGRHRRTVACSLTQEMSFCKVEMMILWTASFNINVGAKILIPMQHLVHIDYGLRRPCMTWMGRESVGWIRLGPDVRGCPATFPFGPVDWGGRIFYHVKKPKPLQERKTSNPHWKLHIKKLINLCRGCRSRWELWWLLYACN